jgi:hypothetical protein
LEEEGFKVTYLGIKKLILGVQKNGLIDLNNLENAIK